ncbi:MAG: hypothetical protein JXA33_09065 [Anaerolineae bacterium]|nr:hypothetical protein [Anaerolineae bacterium]
MLQLMRGKARSDGSNPSSEGRVISEGRAGFDWQSHSELHIATGGRTMRKVELVVPEQDVVPVTEVLIGSGVFHIISGGGGASFRSSDSSQSIAERHEGSVWNEWAMTFTTLEQRILAVMESLEVDEGTDDVGAFLNVSTFRNSSLSSAEILAGTVSPAPTGTPAKTGAVKDTMPEDRFRMITPDVAQRDVERMEQETRGLVEELKRGQEKLTQLRGYIRHLEPIRDLDVDLDALRALHYMFMLPGTIPLDNLERFETSLGHIPYVLVTLRRDAYLATVVLFGLQRDADILNRAARSAYLNPIILPEKYRGTPQEVLTALRSSVQRTLERIGQIQTEIDHLHKVHMRHLRYLLWRVRASRKLVETIASYDRLRNTYVVTGWVPTSDVGKLKQMITQASEQVLFEVTLPQPENDGPIPVMLHNPPFLTAFQGLVTNYGHPGYSEFDPTPVLAFTFPLVFGLMFGDIGHGLLLLLLGWLLTSRKVRALNSLAGLGGVISVCGVFAMGFGALYGSIFGFEDVIPALWRHPLEHITDVLLMTVGVGVGLLSLGMICNIANAALARRWGYLLFDHYSLAGLIFYWSSLGLVARVSGLLETIPVKPAVFVVLMIISGLALTFAELLEHILEGHYPLIEGDVFTYLMQAFFELFETVIGLLSNTLSYVRMGAFAVAHGALSIVVSIIANLVSPTHNVLYWIVIVLGNLFVIGFEGMIVGIQTLRLEYYEFFSKFFSGTGMRFRPLSLVSQEE